MKNIEVMNLKFTPKGLELTIPQMILDSVEELEEGRGKELKKLCSESATKIGEFFEECNGLLEEKIIGKKENKEKTDEKDVELLKRLIGDMEVEEKDVEHLVKLAKLLFNN